ncbi:MAG: DUF411 domain-containing protein [Gammaproteobacteria bacterium]|nr:DUF411 domain-containing protein [Gammaproteobacteria bacterium]
MRLTGILFIFAVFLTACESAEKVEITVYKSATCGCCKKWVSHLEENGFEVISHDVSDVNVIKQKYGVRQDLASCHTAMVNGYVIEGHVPASDIKRFLSNPVTNAIGLTVPGMPMGSPGMEGNRKDDYNVYTFTKDNKIAVYSSH